LFSSLVVLVVLQPLSSRLRIQIFEFLLLLLNNVFPVDALLFLLGLDLVQLKVLVKCFDLWSCVLEHFEVGSHVVLDVLVHFRNRSCWVLDAFSEHLGEILQ
jgi:hypothetical protein